MRMRVLLSQSAMGLHASSGGYKANVSLLQAFQQDGHVVEVIGNVSKKELQSDGIHPLEEYEVKLSERAGATIKAYKFDFNGIRMVGFDCEDLKKSIFSKEKRKQFTQWLHGECECEEGDALQEFIETQIRDFKPTHYIFNDELSLKVSEDLSDIVRIFVIHSVEHLPFGPYAEDPNGVDAPSVTREINRLKKVDCIWAVSKAIRDYGIKYGGVDSKFVPIHPILYGSPKEYHNWNAEYVVTINPGLSKGLPIVISLAEQFADVKFASVVSWSVNDDHLKVLRELTNMSILEPYVDMEQLWEKTKVLLVPSIWYEAFGLVSVEAMLRGIPVIASDSGGLVEAKLGVDYVVPVKPMTPVWSSKCKPEEIDEEVDGCIVPKQNITEWAHALSDLLGSRARYEEVAAASRKAALEYIQGIDRKQYSRYLEESWSAKEKEKET